MILKGLFAGVMALALLISAPAGTQTSSPAAAKIEPPADPESRAKFPDEPPAAIDGLAFVNMVINHSIQPMEDIDHYGIQDKWVMLPEDGKGDCEDYALTKREILRRGGVPVVAVARIRSVFLRDRAGKIYAAHAILEVRLPKRAIAFLDSNFDHLMTRSELEARGYQFFDW